MKSNATIETKAKSKIAKPEFSISDVSSSIGTGATYNKPYGSEDLPIPIPVFPVGLTMEVCLGETTNEDAFSCPVRISVEPSFDISTCQLEIIITGDKFGRFYYTRGYFTKDIAGYPGTANLYETTTFITPVYIRELSYYQGYTNQQKIGYHYAKRFWSCRLIGTTYYSAWSDLVSFDLDFREAEHVPNGSVYQGSDLLTANKGSEAGYLFDGEIYYG